MTDHAQQDETRPAGRRSVPIEQRIEDAVLLMEDLADLLDTETDALERRDFDTFTALQPDKISLSSEYQALIGRLQKREKELNALPDELRAPLIEAAQRLDACMEDNERILDIARQGTTAVIETIIEAARKAVAPNDTYNQDAAVPQPDPRKTAAVSLDEEL